MRCFHSAHAYTSYDLEYFFLAGGIGKKSKQMKKSNERLRLCFAADLAKTIFFFTFFTWSIYNKIYWANIFHPAVMNNYHILSNVIFPYRQLHLVTIMQYFPERPLNFDCQS